MKTFFLPRGIRNNNPGNIRISNAKWQGQKNPVSSGGDNDFVEFISPLYGIRALMKLLLNYYLKHGLDTVESLINRYAPPFENATDMYIYSVAADAGFKRREKINLTDKNVLISVTKAIVRHECGKPPQDMPHYWYEDCVYVDAAKLALEKGK